MFHAKVLTDEEQIIWSTISWPCTVAKVLHKSIEMAKVKSKLTTDAFEAITLMLPPIPAQKIVAIDEGSPLRNPDDIPEEPLPTSPPKFVIDENMQQVLSILNKKQDNG